MRRRLPGPPDSARGSKVTPITDPELPSLRARSPSTKESARTGGGNLGTWLRTSRSVYIMASGYPSSSRQLPNPPSREGAGVTRQKQESKEKREKREAPSLPLPFLLCPFSGEWVVVGVREARNR